MLDRILALKHKFGIVLSIIAVILMSAANLPNYLRMQEKGRCTVGIVQRIEYGTYSRPHARYVYEVDGNEFYGESRSPYLEEIVGRAFVVVYAEEDPGFSRMQFEYEIPLHSVVHGQPELDCSAIIDGINYWKF